VQINLYATFRLAAGTKKINVDLPDGSTILEVIQAAIQSHPALKEHWFDDEDNLYTHVHAFCNGTDAVTLPHGFDTPMSKGDVIDLFPPISGGSLVRVDEPAQND